MSTLQRTIRWTINSSDKVSLKRLAWAFGCAKKGSDEERQLEQLLIDRVKRELVKEAADDEKIEPTGCPAFDVYLGG